jgi:small subunit ribosomal protein S1
MSEEAVAAPLAAEKLGIGTEVKGKVTYLAPYGAMIDIGGGREALLHISQIGRSDFRNIDDIMSIGDEVDAFVLKINKENQVALTMEKPPSLPWANIHKDGVYPGKVIRLEGYGAFVDIGAERPGMVHVSEMADGYVKSPSDVVSVGQEVEVRVIKLNRGKRQIDLSMKEPEVVLETILAPAENIPTPMEIAFRRAEQQADYDRRKNKKKDKKRRETQDDIMERTLRNHRS